MSNTLEGFVGGQAKIIGKHPHNGEIVECLSFERSIVFGEGLRVINDKSIAFYVFKPKHIVKIK